jgi:hypothetical protein
MENFSNDATPWLTLADANKGLNSGTSGDYSNSAELNQGLSQFTGNIAQHNGGLGTLPDMGSNPTPTLQAGQIPTGMPSGVPTALPGSMPQGMPGNNYMSAMPSSTPSADMVSGFVSPAMNMMSNPSVGAPTSGNGNMPKQQVLMEPCTINQPINSSLRENYSTGNFYFLPKT